MRLPTTIGAGYLLHGLLPCAYKVGIMEKSKGSGLFFGPGIGADSQIIAIELLIEPNCFI